MGRGLKTLDVSFISFSLFGWFVFSLLEVKFLHFYWEGGKGRASEQVSKQVNK